MTDHDDHSDARSRPGSAAEDRSPHEGDSDRLTRMLDEFAASLVLHVRDRSVLDVLAALRPDGAGSTSVGWTQELEARMEPQDFARAIVPDIVDLVVTNLLDAIDNQLLSLELTDEASGARLPLTRSGELAGTYLAEDGWRSRFGATSSTSQ